MDNHRDRSRFNSPVIALVYGAVAMFLGFTIVAYKVANIPFSFFSGDPPIMYNAHPLTGIQSNLGVLILVCTAGICFFTSAVLRSRKAKASVFQFFLWSGLITLLLTFDDLFLIHEDLASRYLEIGQKTIFVIYVLLIARYISKFRQTIPHSDHAIFILALIFFALSESVDIIGSHWNSPWRIFFEDGLKLFGIVSWGIYLVRESFRFINTA